MNLFKKRRRRYPCLCCGYLTSFARKSDYDICPVCYWEHDPGQNEDPNLEYGTNPISLTQARKNFLAFGACEEEMMKNTRPPKHEETPRGRAWVSRDDVTYQIDLLLGKKKSFDQVEEWTNELFGHR